MSLQSILVLVIIFVLLGVDQRGIKMFISHVDEPVFIRLDV